MLLNRANWHPHRKWFVLVVLATAGAAAWFYAEALDQPHLPGGSSLCGFTLGIVAALLILFEFLFYFRKKLRAWRLGPVQSWMRAHIWLGLLCLPLALLHGGFRFGGGLSTTLMMLLIVVVVSGIWGLIVQHRLPSRMLDDIPAETIYSQIDALSQQMLAEADRLITAISGVAVRESVLTDIVSEDSSEQVADTARQRVVIVGAERKVGSVWRSSVQSLAPKQPIAEAEPLAAFYSKYIAPFLREGSRSNSELAHPQRKEVLFDSIKTRLPVETHETVALLKDFCEQRRQWESQARIHFWMHNWLWVHFPLSVSLVVLMFVHIFVALKYW